MKNICVLAIASLTALMVVVVQSGTANARPDYNKQFQETYKDSKVLEAAKKAKCNTCHFGKSKKNRNDFGMALSKHLNKDMYKARNKDKEAFKKKIAEALKLVEKEKSTGGMLFGKLIEEGTLPGTAPEEDEKKSD